MRVLLMEMEPPLDVMGLEILVDHRCAVVTNGNTSGGVRRMTSVSASIPNELMSNIINIQVRSQTM